MISPSIRPALVLQPAAAGSSLLLDLLLRLIRGSLLVLQSFLRARIRRWRLNRPGLGADVRRSRHTASPLLLRHLAHAVGDVFLEVVVHLLQVVHFHGNGLSRRAIAFL